jgi:3'(2'), 5'-bisphosphate nucleotidase
MNIKQQLSIAIQASIEAGKKILKIYETDDFQEEKKADNSPLTLADRNAHNKIISFLEKTDIPILSDEGQHLSFEERKNWNYFWLVDPLDGTKEFIKRNGEFTVNIALIKKDTPIASIIYVPVTEVLYFADIKLGAFKIELATSLPTYDFDELIKLSTKLPLAKEKRPYKVVGSRSHLNEKTKNYIEELKKQHPDLEMMAVGSSLKLCMIAEGKADIYPRFGPTMEWDIASGHAIIVASGAKIYKYDGTNMVYNKENLLNPYFIVEK